MCRLENRNRRRFKWERWKIDLGRCISRFVTVTYSRYQILRVRKATIRRKFKWTRLLSKIHFFSSFFSMCICIYTHSLERTFQNRVLACNRVYRITNSRRSKHLHFPITPTDVMQFNSPSPPRDSLIWFEQLTLDDSWRQSHRRNDVSREWNLI